MKKFWFLFFTIWPIAAVVLFIGAPALGWWFPGTGEAATVIGQRIDGLFYLILGITGVVFVGTMIALAYVLWRGATIRDDEKVMFTHGSHSLEIIWSVAPAGILLFLAFYQMDAWGDFAVSSNIPKQEADAEIVVRQFEWRIRYPRPNSALRNRPQPGDLYDVNELHVPVNRPVYLWLKSADVQHSLFIPELRIKKDAIPRTIIPVWFTVTKEGTYDWVCAELCGWGHFKMPAKLVAEPKEKYRAYLRDLERRQREDKYIPPPPAEDD